MIWPGSWSFYNPGMESVSFACRLFVALDSSGSLGFGAIWHNAWLAGSWPASVPAANITALELYPIVVAAHVWGCQWARLQVEFLCDNHAVVAIINSGSSCDPYESGVSSLYSYCPGHVFECCPAAVGLETSGGG